MLINNYLNYESKIFVLITGKSHFITSVDKNYKLICKLQEIS